MMLEIDTLSFDYPDKRVLQNIHFTVNPSELLHLRGANGSGKTTLLKLVSGLLQPTLGEIRYHGHCIADDTATYQQQLCYVGHKTGMSQLLTVRENCYFDLHQRCRKRALDELMHAFSLSGLEDTPCGLLSAGQRRRVGLLRLWLTDAVLWLLDEPLVALDEQAIALFMALLETHRNRGGMVVLSSHQALPLRKEVYQEYCL